jgi:hypothetical protein
MVKILDFLKDWNFHVEDLKKDSFFKINSIFAICLAGAFLLFFQFTKHNPMLAVIIPFGNDPYDAVGSIGIIIAGLLAILALIRSFYKELVERQRIIIARTQFSVVAVILVTLMADIIAMVKHFPMWFGQPGYIELLALMVGIFILAMLLSFAISYSIREIRLEKRSWKKFLLISTILIALLTIYPEFIIQSTLGELFTLLVGVLILFFWMSALPEAFIPFDIESFDSTKTQPHQMSIRKELVAVVLLGMGIGIAVLIGEWRGEGAPAPEHRIILAFIFIGMPLVSLLIAYYCLRKPLALFNY